MNVNEHVLKNFATCPLSIGSNKEDKLKAGGSACTDLLDLVVQYTAI